MGGDPKQTRRKTALYALGLFGGLFAVAMWGKMRFVTDLPRMAYAVPDEQKASAQTQPNPVTTEDEEAQTPDQEREPEEGESLNGDSPETGGF